ncbi:MAG: 16S rRNA (adenine(1518)-N(6)/adenine(1519)-N(6))-dimethyltransferase RsmA [Gammaproteobacteria bacterium]|nr:16S rRNA (adenine(1518)-N(6)/adenine(1519)-N(6))-dimethyltransferase RsmA [Gammaproteobacteria bacterium]MDH5693845.1 16S rRNA (adenine(1518)-N(6)/adenine(1519)-N(6))-dimethyltransferase RsmA [Gammaproteobacteria bacterium]
MAEHRPRKRFGQNFLTRTDIIENIIRTFAPSASDHVVEIGPGQGALSFYLAKRVARLDCVEIDRDLAAWLKEKFAQQSQVQIHQTDALEFQISSIGQQDAARVIGNLPYNISTPLLFHLLEQKDHIKDMLFMLQKEVVDRIVASPSNTKDYGRLSVMCQVDCETEHCFDVPPSAFNPQPKVDSAIVRLVPRKAPLAELKNRKRFNEIVALAFGQRRKMLRRSLKNTVTEAQFEAAAIDPSLRPENLQVLDYIRLSNA